MNIRISIFFFKCLKSKVTSQLFTLDFLYTPYFFRYSLEISVPQKTQKGQIGITLVTHWFVPKMNTPQGLKAPLRALDFMLGW